jgi:hypothetical protein
VRNWAEKMLPVQIEDAAINTEVKGQVLEVKLA